MNRLVIYGSILIFGFLLPVASAQEPTFLRRSASKIQVQPSDLSTLTAHFKPMVGKGDSNIQILKGVSRFGELIVDTGGRSQTVQYEQEEQIYYVLKGRGTLLYGSGETAIKENDFMYLPVGVAHGISNTSDNPIQLLVMGFRVPEGKQVKPTEELMLANADDVKLQVLGQHGPTTQFKLLMGPTYSRRDTLAATSQVTSLFLMDFAPGGTNIPHEHPKEEEIYFVLEGYGEMVAGADSEGNEMRYPASAGDAFYFSPGVLIGFYSNTTEETHSRILAVRSSAIASDDPAKP